jgi:tetratricopeptide (TPR) repeat protein
MRRQLKRSRVNSLEHPVLEFYSPQDFVQPSVQRAHGNMRSFTAMRRYPFDDMAFEQHTGEDRDPALAYDATTKILDRLARIAADEGGRNSKAIDELGRQLQAAPIGAALKYAAADILATQAGNRDPATQGEMLQLAVSLWPNHAGRRLALGAHLLETLDPQAAEPHLRAAVKLNPEDRDAHLDLASALRRLHRPAEGVEHMRVALAIDPSLPGLRTDLGRMLAEIPRYNEAAEQLEAAILTEPSTRAWLSLGLVYSRLNRHNKAIAAFEELLASNPAAPAVTMKRCGNYTTHSSSIPNCRHRRQAWPGCWQPVRMTASAMAIKRYGLRSNSTAAQSSRMRSSSMPTPPLWPSRDFSATHWSTATRP